MAPADLKVVTGLPSPRSNRSHSISSDRPSLQGYGGMLSPPANVSPEPGFIAASAASQIVTNDHDSQADTWFDQHGIEPSGETALVSPQSLKTINRFLDQLLFNFLSVSRSTSLAALRPAVSEVLKPKLAAGAINGADQELNEYLGAGDDDDLLALHNGLEAGGDWDLELVWKRTRLRCMVYSSLGDMEEEDEDYYTEQEHLDGQPGASNRYSTHAGVVSPAVAIFLTSILEFMGEQVLIVAGQAAYHRLRTRHEKEDKDGTETPSEIAERVVVEDYDVEKVGLDRTLGRLWRGWKKRIRSPNTSIAMARSFSKDMPLPGHSPNRAPGFATDFPASELERRPSLAAILAEAEYAANVPLPMRDNDVDEIEVPGLAVQSDNEDEDDESVVDEGYSVPPRPKSVGMFDYAPLTPTSPLHQIFRPQTTRKRSNSVPSPTPNAYISPKRVKASGQDFDSVIPVEKTESDDLEQKEVAETVEAQDATEEKEVATAHVEESPQPKSLVGGVIAGVAGVAAVSAAVVAGVAAATHGQISATQPVEDLENEEDLAEEAQILTSSRVSMGGRVSPEEPLGGISRKSSFRSPSVHSLRIIDVPSTKTPRGSRPPSVDVSDQMGMGRPILSRSSSVYSTVIDSHTPRVGSPVSRAITASPVYRNGSSLSMRRVRNSAGESIAEVEEKGVEKLDTTDSEGDSAPRTAVASDFAGAMQGVDVDTDRYPQGESVDVLQQTIPNHTQPSNFVLGDAPVRRYVHSPLELATSGLPIQSNQTLSTDKHTDIENGAPPLTPLREMMEGAPDTSDEYSDNAPSIAENATDSQFSSTSTSAVTHAQRVIDQQRPGWSSASGNRNSPPRAIRPDTARTIVPDSPTKSQRRHTSESQSSGNSIKMRATRASDEEKGSDNKSESFEQLIRSDQTIQYTLTPQNMRDIETPDSPRSAMPPSMSNSQDFRPSTGRSHSSSVTKLTGLNSNPPVAGVSSVKSAKAFKAIPRNNAASPSNGTRSRPNAPQPRDARIDRDSMGDFTEFIRSTGPVSSYDSQPAITTPAFPARASSHKGANGSARNASGTIPRVGSDTSLPKRAESSAGRSRLQARDAVVPRGDSISDLIDFVRSGPQLDKETHRIPRTVAPFRSTMDSDQMSGAVGGKAIDASLPDPRYSQASNSVNSSITSQAPLLRNKPLPSYKENDFEEEDIMPKRKTRRVRDPYAIDLSDEEEEYAALSGARPQVIQEESLADFLRNVPPPPEPVAPTSVFADVPRPGSKGVKKKSSSPSIMSRFGRNNSSNSQPLPKSRSGPDTIPASSKPLPNHTPIATQYNPPNTSQTDHNPARSDTMQSAKSSRTKVAQKTFQPREAVYTPAARTNDLAEFLMRSEPPSSMATQPQTFMPTVHKEESSAFQRMFGRKKVH